jgi:hypothetical protein
VRKTILSRLTYANVMATGAMFVALGGGAYAVSGTPDRAGVFRACVSKRTGDLRVVDRGTPCRRAKGEGRRRDPGETAISWSQQGPRGLQGVQGVPGPQGVAGQSGVRNLAIRTSGPVTGTNVASASCQPGERAVGGGGVTSGLPITVSLPAVNGTSDPSTVAGQAPNGWRVATASDPSGTREAVVVCASP